MKYNVYKGKEGKLELTASGIDFEFLNHFGLSEGDVLIFEPENCYGNIISFEKIEE